MDYKKFYDELYSPLVATLGPTDSSAVLAIVGFAAGGPLNFCTFGRYANNSFVTYVSCELTLTTEQKPNAVGRYELLASCDSEEWVRSILSNTGRMSFNSVFKSMQTMDIGRWVNKGWFQRKPSLQALLFEQECKVTIDGQDYGILRCIGITRDEMEYAKTHGSPALVSLLKKAGVYPHSITSRRSVT